MGLLNNFARNTYAALTAIDEGRVRWNASGMSRISFHTAPPAGVKPADHEAPAFAKISERFYERQGWDIASSGPVYLSVAGKVELEHLKTEFEA